MGKHSGEPANETPESNPEPAPIVVMQDTPADNQVLRDVFNIDHAYGDY